jgi:hypothetical protein
MDEQIISDKTIQRRAYWGNEIKKLRGNFSNNYDRLQAELTNEIKQTKQSRLRRFRVSNTYIFKDSNWHGLKKVDGKVH